MFFRRLAIIDIFHEAVKWLFNHLTCFLCSTVNKICICEICKSFHSVVIYILRSVPTFLGLRFYRALEQAWKCKTTDKVCTANFIIEYYFKFPPLFWIYSTLASVWKPHLSCTVADARVEIGKTHRFMRWCRNGGFFQICCKTSSVSVRPERTTTIVERCWRPLPFEIDCHAVLNYPMQRSHLSNVLDFGLNNSI